MHIVVHTTNRATLVTGTLQALHDAKISCIIACPAAQARTYEDKWASVRDIKSGSVTACLPVPDSITGLPKTQQYIFDRVRYSRDKTFCMLDDDLLFFAREPGTKKRHKCSPAELRAMFSWLASALKDVVHAGIMVNKDMGLQDITPPVDNCGPMRSVLAYRADALDRIGARFDRVVSKSDYDVALTLYRKGCEARISRMFGHEQCGGPDLPGGATDYRDEAMHVQASEGLAKLHPEFVTVVDKARKGWSFTRKDVRVQWRKALASAAP